MQKRNSRYEAGSHETLLRSPFEFFSSLAFARDIFPPPRYQPDIKPHMCPRRQQKEKGKKSEQNYSETKHKKFRIKITN